MIKSLTFIKNHELSLEKKSQKHWGTKTYKPTNNTRETKPWKMFFLFRKGLHIDFQEGVNIIVGENGSGKSTLFSLIKNYAGKPPNRIAMTLGNYKTEKEYIEKHKKSYLNYGCLEIQGDVIYKNTVFFDGEKDNPITVIPQMLNPEDKSFMNLTLQLFNAQEESHGESMLPVLKYILETIKDITIFMDEPETALSPKSQLELLDILRENCNKGHAQFIIATHSPILLAYEDAKIYSFDHSPVSEIEYKKTEHYQIYKSFLLER
jgi:predicted ATPase